MTYYLILIAGFYYGNEPSVPDFYSNFRQFLYPTNRLAIIVIFFVMTI